MNVDLHSSIADFRNFLTDNGIDADLAEQIVQKCAGTVLWSAMDSDVRSAWCDHAELGIAQNNLMVD
jgi:hypothetical protein